MDLLVEVLESRHVRHVGAATILALLIGGEQIGEARALARRDEAPGSRAVGGETRVVEAHLTALQGEKHIRAAAIAADDLVRHAERLQREMRENARKIRRAIGADDEVLGLHDVGGLLEAAGHGVDAHVVHAHIGDAAEIGELVIARAKALIAERLRQRIPEREDDLRSILRRLLIDIVEGEHAASARHVLHDDGGLSGNVLLQMRRNKAHQRVCGAAGGEANDDRQRLARIKVLRHRRAQRH